MSKSKHKYYDDYYVDEEGPSYQELKNGKKDKRKQRRIDHALKTKNIDELMEYEDELE